MRIAMVYTVTRRAARKLCPWASILAMVTGGFMCFESPEDYRTWRKATLAR